MPAIIALLLQGLAWLFETYIGQMIIKGLFALGIGLFTTQVALPAMKAQLATYASGLGGNLFFVFGAIGADVAFTMILSAYAAAVAGNIAIKAMKK